MPRLLGVEIPAEKRIEASLTYIYGIGPAMAKRILERTNIDPNLRAKSLTPQQVNEIIQTITANKIKIEGDLRREVQAIVARAIEVVAFAVTIGPEVLRALPDVLSIMAGELPAAM